MADSGASINVLDEEDYRKLPKSAKLEQSGVKIFAYQSTNPLQVLGKFTAITASTTKNISARFYVVKGSGGSLLSWKTSQELNLLQTVKQVTEKTPQGKTQDTTVISSPVPENAPNEPEDTPLTTKRKGRFNIALYSKRRKLIMEELVDEKLAADVKVKSLQNKINYRKRKLYCCLRRRSDERDFDTLADTEAGAGDDPSEKAAQALTGYFTPRQNREFQIYKFLQATQEPDESITAFHTRLRQLATSCEFNDIDREIKTQIVQSCISHKLRMKALENPSYSLTQLLDAGKAMELSRSQAASIEKQDSLPRICRSKNKAPDRKSRRPVNKISDSESSDEEEAYTFSLSTPKTKDQPFFKIKVQGTPVTIMADSGASINVLDEEDYRKLPKSAKLEQSGVKIFAYQSTNPLQVLGKFTAITASTTKNVSARFYVVKGPGSSLLSWNTSQELNLLQTVQQVTAKTPQGKTQGQRANKPHRRI
ncbi:predicted protein [Nematostella vectensis]|uniref:Retropepsins domain-containing protein n=1 Tax=Nematostella vectensis TaxID=45351 RepID=A7SUX6_NEMVE|nr:predicted protein [Nematostella vectensis]|eukprot:XP_001624588.1 predicted protein [Nematostella vectensis]